MNPVTHPFFIINGPNPVIFDPVFWIICVVFVIGALIIDWWKNRGKK